MKKFALVVSIIALCVTPALAREHSGILQAKKVKELEDNGGCIPNSDVTLQAFTEKFKGKKNKKFVKLNIGDKKITARRIKRKIRARYTKPSELSEITLEDGSTATARTLESKFTLKISKRKIRMREKVENKCVFNYR